MFNSECSKKYCTWTTIYLFYVSQKEECKRLQEALNEERKVKATLKWALKKEKRATAQQKEALEQERKIKATFKRALKKEQAEKGRLSVEVEHKKAQVADLKKSIPACHYSESSK